MKIIKFTQTKSNEIKNNYFNIVIEHEGEIEVYTVHESNDVELYAKVEQLLKELSINSQKFRDKLFSLISVKGGIVAALYSNKILSDKFCLKNGALYFNDNLLEGTLASYVIKTFENKDTNTDRDWRSIVRFVDNLYQNVDDNVRKELFKWMNSVLKKDSRLTITEDGCFIGYKGCLLKNGQPYSIHSGTAYVDGVKHSGHIPNNVKTVISMPRSEVESDSNIHCSHGLHVGTYDYAKDFSRGVLLVCKVNPRDVVSVPSDCGGEKLRCCEYTVLQTQVDLLKEDVFYEDEEVNDKFLELNVGSDYIVELKNNKTYSGTITSSSNSRKIIKLDNGSGYRTITPSNLKEVKNL